MNMNLSFATIKKAINAFLHRFHVMIFVIIVLGGVIVVILLLNGVIQRSGESGDYTPRKSSASFDQATIKKIEDLKTRDQSSGKLDLSHGRSNPFVE